MKPDAKTIRTVILTLLAVYIIAKLSSSPQASSSAAERPCTQTVVMPPTPAVAK